MTFIFSTNAVTFRKSTGSKYLQKNERKSASDCSQIANSGGLMHFTWKRGVCSFNRWKTI